LPNLYLFKIREIQIQFGSSDEKIDQLSAENVQR